MKQNLQFIVLLFCIEFLPLPYLSIRIRRTCSTSIHDISDPDILEGQPLTLTDITLTVGLFSGYSLLSIL